MRKSEADRLANNVFEEYAAESRAIIDKAKQEGKWSMGLDANNLLFEESMNRARKKLAEIWEQIDDFDN